jgi:general secretion pathway protein I
MIRDSSLPIGPAPRRQAAGFALLEVIIAFIIAAAALGVLFHTGIGSLRDIQTAARYEEALSRARSRLAIATHGAPLAPGDMEGDDGGGYHWQLHVAPMSTTAVRPIGLLDRERPTWVKLALYNVSLRLTWADRGGDDHRREVRLETQHLQASPQ